ncbi:MAG: SAM-dependent chlorinase/fluorinase [Chitinophagaceae bacterium]|nr:SAM-dependent chlorinase/fluorinase [Chitinophagaceae bacterium]
MPIVTLTTDIGQQDYIVGALKGQLLSANPDLTIIDISHFLTHTNFPEAVYICSNAFKYFPEKTIHLIIFNFYENKNENILIAEFNNQFIICADNGILQMITNQAPTKIFALHINKSEKFLETTQKISAIVNELSNNKTLAEIAEPIKNYVVKNNLLPSIFENLIKGHVIFIDNFENVVTNITQELFEKELKGRKFQILLTRGDDVEVLSDNYLSVPEGEKLAWFNSAGYLELAINKGNMAGMFGFQDFNELNYKEGKSMQNKIFYKYVQINFYD